MATPRKIYIYIYNENCYLVRRITFGGVGKKFGGGDFSR